MIEFRHEVAGYYTFCVGKGDKVRQVAHIKNLILNGGLDLIFTRVQSNSYTPADLLYNCCIGLGTGVPQDTDVSLQTYLASTDKLSEVGRGQTADANLQTYWWVKNKYRFTPGNATGNISEVGIFPRGGTKDNLFSRANITDEAGNPTTITVLADEYLDVYYEYRVYFTVADQAFSWTVNNVTYTGTQRLYDYPSVPDITQGVGVPSEFYNAPKWYASDNAIVPPDQHLYGTGGIGVPITANPEPIAYVLGAYYFDSVQHWDITQANFAAGIKRLIVTTEMHKYQIGFVDSTGGGIPKTSSQKFTITARFSWARKA